MYSLSVEDVRSPAVASYSPYSYQLEDRCQNHQRGAWTMKRVGRNFRQTRDKGLSSCRAITIPRTLTRHRIKILYIPTHTIISCSVSTCYCYTRRCKWASGFKTMYVCKTYTQCTKNRPNDSHDKEIVRSPRKEFSIHFSQINGSWDINNPVEMGWKLEGSLNSGEPSNLPPRQGQDYFPSTKSIKMSWIWLHRIRWAGSCTWEFYKLRFFSHFKMIPRTSSKCIVCL